MVLGAAGGEDLIEGVDKRTTVPRAAQAHSEINDVANRAQLTGS